MKFQQKTSMTRTLSALAPLLFAASALAAPATFRAPSSPFQVVTLPAPKAAELAPAPAAGGPLKVGDVRALPRAVALARWEAVDGGFVARVRAESTGAQGLRVRLELGTVPGAMEARVQGSGADRIESQVLDPTVAGEAWTAWTEGQAQLIEVFSPVAPSSDAVRVGAMVHFDQSPLAKAAASCTLSTSCPSGDAALDAQIEERKKSNLRIVYTSAGRSYTCSATLIDTPRNPAPYVITANHCINSAPDAGSITSFWFYESTPCTPPTSTSPAFVQQPGGMQLVFANPNVDSTLLLSNQAPPDGVTYAPVNTAIVPDNAPVVSISHPTGDTSRWALGTMVRQTRFPSGLLAGLELPFDVYYVEFSRGLIQGGSSGSGLFVRNNGRLELAGVTSVGPSNATCDSSVKYGYFPRLEAFYPMISQYIGASSPGPDDAPNRHVDVTTSVSTQALDQLAQPLTFNGRLEYAGDIDIYRFTLNSRAVVTAYTQSGQDLVATLLDAGGTALEANDDAQLVADAALGMGRNDPGITRELAAGTYYLQVGHWVPTGTAAYSVVLRADRLDPNHTSLWWDANESGWGINVNHQGDIVFATLFTYDDTGAPMWLVMSRGERGADGAYSGALYRTTGPAFNASPWGAVTLTQVGTMRIVFNSNSTGANLTYSVNGRSVSKVISRQEFKTLPTCGWSFFDRSFEGNFQDLWWNPAESGWGLNIAHQQSTLFGTLFTYLPNGQGQWLVMSNGAYQGSGRYSGPLYRTRGPAFDASPWGAVTLTEVGTMTVDFSTGNGGINGNSARLTYTIDGVSVAKPIERQVFAALKTKCE